ncbi:MAG: AAA family ATPase [Deltaproteobacteria bacterium HGW-Deltaproteobacteria-15]|nr:MAG: AAA family ATPase [Deltaproteobacteria bacterium HGW-Deltaproteobacteria-15]
MSTTSALRPWTDLVKLHPDVEAGALTEAVFAVDLGAIAANDPNVPVVNRDPEAFFRSTYLTSDLRKLLEEVLASLSGKSGYNRVLKLRTPFGGGKSHTLASLLHAARKRDALDGIPEGKGFARPGEVAVAVFDGEKFDARNGKTLEDGRTVQTMWGWIAWQIDPEKAFPIVADHDKDRVAPGGDVIRDLLTKGAGGRPVLILLDEVLKYMERAAAVGVLESTLQRQAKDFFQNLTVEVAGSEKAALVYSLTWSAREALGNVGLLAEIDKLASRVDQLREPVSGDEVLPILQRRLLGSAPDAHAATEVATAYQEVVTGMQRAHAETSNERQQAEEDGQLLRDRMRAAYPFHPALIDIMRERWTAVDAFQRTRGALRFLASCMHSLKKNGGAKALLGPGEVPVKDVDVRVKMLKELGVQNDYDAVITADIDGPNARARRIDERMARETPSLASVKPATCIATAILLYSFGGLRREKSGMEETLPPGITENELLASCVGPHLDNITATAVLSELRNACLYLHYDGVRYCFKKDPNVTKLIEDAEQTVAREDSQVRGLGPVRSMVKEMLEARLAGHHTAIVWPAKSQDIPDEDPRFLIAYLPLEFAAEGKAEQERQAKEYLSNYGDRPRRFRNGLGLAIPEKKQIEALRRAVRYLLAIDRVEAKKQQLRLTKDHYDQLKERKRTEQAAAESCFRELYSAVWLPRVQSGELEIQRVERGGRPLQATGVYERMMELLTSEGIRHVNGTIFPKKVVERVRLGETTTKGETPLMGIKAYDVLESFFRDIAPPRLESAAVLRKGIARGVSEGVFAYASGGSPTLGSDGKFQVSSDKVVLGRYLADDEIDLDSGFLMLPAAVPEALAAQPSGTTPGGPDTVTSPGVHGEPTGAGAGTGSGPSVTAPEVVGRKKRIILTFEATREQVFKAFPAIANLADKSDGAKVRIRVEGTSEDGFDQSWLRNAVDEPLDEADIERTEE